MAQEGEAEDDSIFVPWRRFYGSGPAGRRERDRERHFAEHASKARAHGQRQPGGRARGLRRADIVAAAIAIADAEGTGGLSIRRIARDLRAGPMSLYWHVASTEELHHLMLEQVQAETRVPEPSGDWRADLRRYAASARSALLRHPWAIDLLGAGPPSGPNDARNADRLIGTLGGLGLDVPTTMWALMTFTTYVTGAALREVQEIRWHRAAAAAEAEMTAAEIDAAQEELGRRILGSSRYPHLARVFEAGFDPDAPETRDERFEFGLGCVLDGIAARISAARITPYGERA